MLRIFRPLAVLFMFLLATLPAAAQVDIFGMFNVGPAMDANAKVLERNLAYSDGERRKLDIYGPVDPHGPSPVVMFIYGGAWDHGNKEGYEFAGRALAANGFVVVIPDYRLYPDVRYPDFLVDNAAAVKWIEDNIGRYGGDTKRFYLAGHSAGAYNAVMLGVEKSFLRDFGVTMPIQAIAAISGPYDFYPFEYDQVRNTFDNTDNPEGTQPINLVTPGLPPMFLASGTSDPIVRVQNTQNLAKKLLASGDWVTEKYYDGFGHLEPVFALGQLWRWRMPILQDVVNFFTQFGAFPSGVPVPVYTPAPPEGMADMQTTIARLDTLFEPISNRKGGF
ncbi:MAG TPA: alpha/beta hydrolase [Devosia sp.]|nr:alpha/beta hydrolase [Devosia sp.]